MLPKPVRLHLRSYANLFNRGKRFSGKFLKVVYTLPLDTQEKTKKISQGAVIVSKVVLPKAVQRNKLKRQIRALLTHQLKKHPGLKIAVIVKTTSPTLSIADLKKDIKIIFNNITHV